MGLTNLLGTDGKCEDTSKFTYTGGTAALDSTRKTNGNNSIKVAKSSTTTTVDPQAPKRIYPAVGEYYIAIADLYSENLASAVYMSAFTSGVTQVVKSVTSTSSSSYSATTTGQFVPIIRAWQVTAVTTPGVSYFYPRALHNGTTGAKFNVDSFRVYKISQAQYDALPTNVDLATAQAIAAQYPYTDYVTGNTFDRTDLFVWDTMDQFTWDEIGIFNGQGSAAVTFTTSGTAVRVEIGTAGATIEVTTDGSVYAFKRNIARDMRDYLPKYYSDSAVVENLIEREAGELQVLNAEIQSVLDQFFVDYAMHGLDRWEKIYGIPTDYTKTIEQRRAAIKARQRATGTTTLDMLYNLARTYYNVEITENPANYEIIINGVGTNGIPPNLDEFKAIVRDVVPAHLAVTFTFGSLYWLDLDAAVVTFNTAETKSWDQFETSTF
ncbi:YmfQ family protein [Brevibacillus sp. SYP-B805]|uniref:putative phage tail protein n=1 Tax=Brevibacillus sp. SYP-B805 TaxID=1578199 RepID=UPI0013EB399E|nr:putative phage tail protein [Brevibacillus sp. SYP-B805]NGQ95511.1 YmfQ family protein [Brevibacillus sp. SYP-B805]